MLTFTLTLDSQNLQARSVDLLGSWDNFTKPYPMKLDARRGGDQWTGCYAFDDIAFDGDEFIAGGVRSGGLKMGGTYWYYYSIDGGLLETFNEAEPHSTQCPLLPGQRVNILEVPTEGPPASRRSSTSSTPAVPTLDPQDRYVNPRPAPSPMPSPPSLVTAASEDATTFALALKRHKRPQQPATAAGDSFDYGRLAKGGMRQLRTAAATSTSTVKSAFAFLKGLDAAITPIEPSRARSRTWPTNDRSKGPAPKPQTAEASLHDEASARRPPVVEQTMCSPPQTAASAPSRCRVIDATHKRHTSDSPIPSPKLMIGPFHVRSVSANDAGHKHAGSPPSGLDQRQLLSRASSKRQGMIHEHVYDIPTGLPQANVSDWSSLYDEFEEQGLRIDWASSASDRPHWQSETGPDSSYTLSPIIDKELPPLPTYLIPDPLNIPAKSDQPDDEELLPTPAEPQQDRPWQSRFSEWTVNQSRFSEWTAYSVDNEEALEFDDGGSGGDMSPTFSSVQGESLDAMTPRFLSVHTSPSVDEQLSLFAAPHGEEQTNDITRPDLDALRELREAISKSSLSSNNAFEPPSFLSGAHKSGQEPSGLSELKEASPATTASSKLHGALSSANAPLVAGESTLMAELMTEFDYLGEVLS